MPYIRDICALLNEIFQSSSGSLFFHLFITVIIVFCCVHLQDDTCRFSPDNVGATDSGYVDVDSGDEDALKEACAANGPISVAIDASHESFQLYESGVYDEESCSSIELDHGVLVVGYGTDSVGGDYWIVKNRLVNCQIYSRHEICFCFVLFFSVVITAKPFRT